MTFQFKKFTFNSIIVCFGLYLIHILTDVHGTCNCSYFIHLMTNRIFLLRNQTLQGPETSLVCFRVLPCPFLKLQKLRHMQTTLLKVLILLFCVHIVSWVSQQRCQFLTLISCPSLFIQSFKNPYTLPKITEGRNRQQSICLKDPLSTILLPVRLQG